MQMPQRPVLERPKPQRRRPRPFRWYFLALPLLVFVAGWIAQGIQPACTWDEVMDQLDIRDRAAFTQMAALGVLVTSGLALLRVSRGPGER